MRAATRRIAQPLAMSSPVRGRHQRWVHCGLSGDGRRFHDTYPFLSAVRSRRFCDDLVDHTAAAVEWPIVSTTKDKVGLAFDVLVDGTIWQCGDGRAYRRGSLERLANGGNHHQCAVGGTFPVSV